MKIVKYDRHGILLLSTVAILFALLSVGCLQSNESKIVGRWKAQSIDNNDGSVQYIYINFHKKGLVSKNIGIMPDGQSFKPKVIMIGKYKFEDDKIISFTWDDGSLEKTNVSFPQKNKMLLGKYEMEKIK